MKKLILLLAIGVVITILILMAVIFYEIPALFSSDNPKECRQNLDCTVVVTGCYQWSPVNKAHRNSIIRQLCGATVGPGPKPTVECVTNTCRISDKKPNWLGVLKGKIWSL